MKLILIKELKKEFKGKLYNVESYRYNQSIITKEFLRLSKKYNLAIADSLNKELKEKEILEVPDISKWQNNMLSLSKTNSTDYRLTRKNISKASFIRIKDIDVSQGGSYEVSILVKKSDNSNFVGLRLQSKYPNRVDAIFNLKEGTLKGVKRIGAFEDELATITSLKNGWYKCTIKARIFSEQLNVLVGPTDGSKGVTNWEGPNKIVSSIILNPEKTTIKSIDD